MKTPSDRLYQLVHALDMNEKRYLSLFAGQLQKRSSSKQYLDIIRRLDRQPEYDEQKLKTQSGMNDPDSFKRMKHYAFEITLRSLENFHANSSPETQILRKFIQAEILLRKKQFATLRRCIDQAYHLCLEYDKLVFLPVCLDWKLRTGLSEPRLKNSGNVAEKELLQCLRHFNAWLQMRRINVLSWKLITRETPPDAREKKLVHEWIRQSKKLVPEGELDFTLVRELSQVMSTCYRLLGDWKTSFYYRKKFVGHIESEPGKLVLRAHEYFSALNNLYIAANRLGKSTNVDFFTNARRFYEKLPAKHRTMRVTSSYINLVNNHVAKLIGEREIEEAYRNCKPLLKAASEHRFEFGNSLVTILYNNMTQLSIYRGEFREALRYQNKLEHFYESPHPFVLVPALIVHYEMREFDLLHYRVRSLRNLLRKQKKDFAWVDCITHALSTYLVRANGKKEKAAAFTRLQTELGRIPDLAKQLRDYEYFDFREWISANIKQQGIPESVQAAQRLNRKKDF